MSLNGKSLLKCQVEGATTAHDHKTVAQRIVAHRLSNHGSLFDAVAGHCTNLSIPSFVVISPPRSLVVIAVGHVF